MKGTRVVKVTLILLSAYVAAAPAQATLLDGKTVHMQYLNPDLGSVYWGFDFDYVVGPGVEATHVVGTQMNVDLSDTTILFTFDWQAAFSSGGTFNGIHIEDTQGAIPDIDAVSLSANPGTVLPPGYTSSRVTYDANNIYVDFRGVNPGPSNTVRLDLTVVPEPAGVLLATAGLLSILAVRGRRERVGKTR